MRRGHRRPRHGTGCRTGSHHASQCSALRQSRDVEWTGARYADKRTVEVQTWIDASPSRVWQVVSNIELMPTMSLELQSVDWLDGATEASVGARFVGRSRHESLGEWSTTSEIIECDSERVLAWAVEDR